MSKLGWLQTLRHFYRNHETEESKKRIEALRDVCDDLKAEGIEATIFANGSLAFGMSERGSDIEFMYVGDSSGYSSNKEIEQEIGRRMQEKMGYEIDMDVNGVCDTRKVREQLNDPSKGFSDLIALYKWSKVDMPIDDSMNTLISEVERLRHQHLPLDSALKADSHIPARQFYTRSFGKYNARLQSRGVEVTEDIQRTLESFAKYF